MRSYFLAAVMLTAFAGHATAQPGRVSGTVRDERGEPIRGATIIAENADASPSSFTASSDDRGRFGIIGLKSGLWAFRVGAPGYSADGGELNVRALPGVTPPINFTLAKLVVPPSALGSVEPKDLQAALARADELYNNGRWDEAITAYGAILARSPSLSVIKLQIAAAHRQRKAFDEAIRVYRELLQLDPTNDRAIVGIAMASLEKGDVDTAEQTLENAARSPGATRQIFFDLGEVKLARSRTDEAVRAYERALEVDPTWGKPLLALGRIALERGDQAAARRYFQTIMDVDPVSPEAADATTRLRELEPIR